MKTIKQLLGLILFLAIPSFAVAQTNTDDTSSPTNITEAVLDVISGEKGEARNWDRFRNLFLPTAQLNAVFHRADSSFVRVTSLDDFIERAGTWYEDNGFTEYSIKSEVEEYGHIASVFQTYGSTFPGGTERGINSYQLVYDKGRWWVANLLWEGESEEYPLPEKYLD